MKRRFWLVLVYAALLYVFYFPFRDQGVGVFWIALFLFPYGIGAATQVILDPKVQMPTGQVTFKSFIVFTILGLGLTLVQVETIICLLMALPFLILFSFLGILSARQILRDKDSAGTTRLRASVLVVPLLIPVLVPDFTPPQRFETVTNTIRIAAPPEVVWAQIIEFPAIAETERLWTVSHNILGAPMPVRSFVQGNTRYAIWTSGVAYEEQFTDLQPGRKMAWDIVFSENFTMDGFDKHISPSSEQLRLLSGSYDLAYDGQVTTLTLSTRYRLGTLANPYVALWGQRFLGDNHNSILNVLKLRSELAL
jgi:hypothetical protein